MIRGAKLTEIDVTKYFIIHKDKNNNIFAIEQINPKELFEEITKQNKQLQRYEQVIKEIKENAKNFCNACKEFEPNKCNEINLRYCNYNKIIQKCEEVNVL